jgi:phosphohistidine phosphatase
MKRLAVLRHAKSDWDNPRLDDFHRPLNSRGRQAAQIIAREVKQRGLTFDLVIASPAIRVRETLELFERSEAIGETRFEPKLYLADLTTLLSLIRALPDEISSALLVGHNPGLHKLVLSIAKGPMPLEEKIADKFPTAALADLEISSERWSEVEEKSAVIRTLLLPKDLD